MLDLLVMADLHSANSVRTLALKFIVENSREIVNQVNYYLYVYIHSILQLSPKTLVKGKTLGFWHYAHEILEDDLFTALSIV